MLDSRADLRFEDGFGDLVFVDGEIDDPRWFEESDVKIVPPPDQAKPVIWAYPRGICIPGEGRVITDFGPN